MNIKFIKKYISYGMARNLPCVKDKTQRMIWMNHDKWEVNYRENITNRQVKSIL